MERGNGSKDLPGGGIPSTGGGKGGKGEREGERE